MEGLRVLGRFRAWTDAALWPEREALMLWAPVALAAGIALWFGLDWVEWRRVALGALLAGAAAGMLLRGLGRRAVVAGLLLVAAGMLLAEARSEAVAGPRLVFRLPAEALEGRVVAVERGTEAARMVLALPGGRVRVSVPGSVGPEVAPGAVVRVRATLGPVGGAAVPGGYDPARRAWFEGVGASGRARGPVQVLRAAPLPGGLAWMAAARARLTAWVVESVGGEAGGVAASLVTGDQRVVPEDVRDAMRDSGLAHLLSVSGYHIAVVLGGTMWLLRPVLARWQWLAKRVSVRALAGVAGGVMATLYTLLAGAEVPAVRACLMAWVVVLAWVTGRDPLSLRLVAAAALVVLVGRPEAALSPGFQLSFGAVAVLVAVGGSRLGRRLGTPGAWWGQTMGRRALLLLLTGVAIELALAPVAAFHFGRQGAWGALANLVGIPWTSVAVMPAVGLLLAGGAVGVDLGAPAAFTIDALIALARWVAGLPGAVARVGTVPVGAFVLMGAGGLAMATFATWRRWCGAVPVAAGVAWAWAAPLPVLLVAPGGAHAAVVHGDAMWMLRRGGGRTLEAWEAAVGAEGARPLADMPGAQCGEAACAVVAGGRRLLLVRSGAELEAGSLVRACAAADVVVADRSLPETCRPGLLLDRVGLHALGAVALGGGGLESVGPGDHPWMPAVVGVRRRLLGPDAWEEPMS